MALPRSHRPVRRALGTVVGAIVLASLIGSLTPDVAAATTSPTPAPVSTKTKTSATGSAKNSGLSAAALARLPADVRSSVTKLALIATFKAEADRYGVPADLLMSVAYTESSWRSSVVSADGAIGICQLLPATARWLARDLIGLPGLRARDPEDNIRMGARFLRQLLRSFRTERLALAAYFDGHGTVTRTGVSTAAARYVRIVQKRRSMFQGL